MEAFIIDAIKNIEERRSDDERPRLYAPEYLESHEKPQPEAKKDNIITWNIWDSL